MMHHGRDRPILALASARLPVFPASAEGNHELPPISFPFKPPVRRRTRSPTNWQAIASDGGMKGKPPRPLAGCRLCRLASLTVPDFWSHFPEGPFSRNRPAQAASHQTRFQLLAGD